MPLLICFFIAQILFSASIPAEIYKWKDSEGKVHFSDRDLEQSGEQVILKRDISEEKVEQASQRAKEFIWRQQRKMAFKKEEAGKAREQEKKETETREKRNRYCSQAKKELGRLKLKVPVYRANKAGERVYIDDAQRAAEIDEWSRNIRKYCG